MDRSTPVGRPMRTATAIANAAIGRLGPHDFGSVVYTGADLRLPDLKVRPTSM